MTRPRRWILPALLGGWALLLAACPVVAAAEASGHTLAGLADLAVLRAGQPGPEPEPAPAEASAEPAADLSEGLPPEEPPESDLSQGEPEAAPGPEEAPAPEASAEPGADLSEGLPPEEPPASEAAQGPAEAPITLEGQASMQTRPFGLRGGDYAVSWTAQTSNPECAFTASLHAADTGAPVQPLAAGQVFGGRASGQASLHDLPGSAYYVDAISTCRWSLTISPAQ